MGMVKYFLIVLLIIALLILLIIIRNQKRKRALFLMQKESQKITNKAFSYAIHHVNLLELKKSDTQFNSEFVSSVWGSKVTAFEFSLEVPGIQTADLPQIKAEVQFNLQKYAEKHQLKAYKEHLVFYVSDIWIFSNVLHIDVSHIINEETWAYVEDVQKSDKTK